MLCDLPCPYLGMHQSLEVFACWQRDESCSLSPAAQEGCSSTLPVLPLDLTLPSSSSCPGPGPSQAPRCHSLPACHHPVKDRAQSETPRLRQSLSLPLSLCKLTQNVGQYSLKIKHPPQREKLAGMPVMTNTADQDTEPVSPACILKALTFGAFS